MRLKRATYRHVETLIYDYEETLGYIRGKEKDIIYGGGRDMGMPILKGYTGTSPVERSTIRLDSLQLDAMRRFTGAVEDAYGATRDVVRRTLWVKYDLAIDWEPPEELVKRMGGRNRRGMAVVAMAGVLGIDASTFHRHRTGFVYAVARNLGWW